LAAKALSKLMAQSGLSADRIGVLALVTQNGDGFGLPHTSAIVHKKVGLSKSIPVFDISLGCSGYVYGLSILQGFMQVAGLSNGVLLTADPYSKILDSNDSNTSLLFGDAATATWLSDRCQWEILPCSYLTDGSGANYLMVNNGVFVMNGRQVFNFALMNVPIQIRQILQREGITEEDIDLFCLHQGSAAIVQGIARKFPSVQDRFIIDIEKTGNTVSSSIPLLLEKHLKDREIKRVLLSGFGVGLSLATTVIQRRDMQCNYR
jgi:3-oxoacyl-[acyl-carrier-protein] synthase-3